jgi:SMI1/KNR4 family protein SUKH-1
VVDNSPESAYEKRRSGMADNTADRESADDRSELLWERLRAYVQTPPPEAQREGAYRPDGEFESIAPVPYPPASEEQLRETEAELGFPLPAELRRFYAEIANGGRHIGTELLYGAAGGCLSDLWGADSQKTIGQLASHSGWRLHPRIEEALLRHPNYFVYVDSLPEGFLLLGELEGYPDTTVLDSVTGRVYVTNYPYWFEVLPITGEERHITWLTLQAPSLRAWFDRWLGAWSTYTGHTAAEPWQWPKFEPLTADLVETADLPDPEVVWRGLYRFGPDWWEEQPVDDDLIESINQWIDATVAGDH